MVLDTLLSSKKDTLDGFLMIGENKMPDSDCRRIIKELKDQGMTHMPLCNDHYSTGICSGHYISKDEYDQLKKDNDKNIILE